MPMEALNRSDRIREYKQYPPNVRGEIAIAFLRDKKLGHREIDKNYLGLDPQYTKGFQSMGVLHYLGIKDIHHGALSGMEIDAIIQLVSNLPNSEDLVADIIAHRDYQVREQKTLDAEFQRKVENSLQEDANKRLGRLKNYDGKPRRIQTVSYAFERNPDIVAEALIRAKGVCEQCMMTAPFIRKSDGTPYLEVHHKIPLSDNGKDVLDNVLALCPNCHRKMHHGVNV